MAKSILSQEQWDLLWKNLIAKNEKNGNITHEQWAIFQHVCDSKQLDPLQNQVIPTLRWNKTSKSFDMALITSIDGYRLIADRTGKYIGSHVEYLTDENENIVGARVTVKKLIGEHVGEFDAIAYLEEYADPDGPLWKKMKLVMIAKCAEALALRKAFPVDLGELYIEEEFDRQNFERKKDEQETQAVKPPVDMAVMRSEKGQAYLLKFKSAKEAIAFIAAEKQMTDEAESFINELFESKTNDNTPDAPAK